MNKLMGLLQQTRRSLTAARARGTCGGEPCRPARASSTLPKHSDGDYPGLYNIGDAASLTGTVNPAKAGIQLNTLCGALEKIRCASRGVLDRIPAFAGMTVRQQRTSLHNYPCITRGKNTMQETTP
ncbi:hypothetical protein [Dyella humi]